MSPKAELIIGFGMILVGMVLALFYLEPMVPPWYGYQP